MNLEFLNSGRAPLLYGHNMNDQIGVVETVGLDEDARRLRAIVRFGKSQRASEMFDDVRDEIRMNISVGYRIDGRVEREDEDEIVRVEPRLWKSRLSQSQQILVGILGWEGQFPNFTKIS